MKKIFYIYNEQTKKTDKVTYEIPYKVEEEIIPTYTPIDFTEPDNKKLEITGIFLLVGSLILGLIAVCLIVYLVIFL